MRTTLTTKVPLQRFAVFAEMAWMARRPELGLLCRAAQAHQHRISRQTIQQGLPGLTDAGIDNLLGYCEMLGLCDAQGALTELGVDVAEELEAPVPEQGVYDLWTASHPLLGHRILSVQRLSSNRDHRFEDIQPLPSQPDLGVVFTSVLRAEERFILTKIPSQSGQPGCLPGTTKGTCRLRWTLDFEANRDEWILDGRLEGPQGMTAIQHRPETQHLDLQGLLASWAMGPLQRFGRWEGDRLKIATKGLSPKERDSFKKTLKLPLVEVPGRGTYGPVVLEDVPIGPRDANEAQDWALDRLGRDLKKKPSYRSRGAVRRLYASRTEDTPLAPQEPSLPTHQELIDYFKDSPEVYWGLAAPVDLAVSPPSKADLGPLKISGGAAGRASTRGGSVRLPHRAKWPMRRLVDALLGGTKPKRVLLCDRYVRGPDNLQALRLMVEALREVNASVVVEVWSEKQGRNLQEVREITRCHTHTYSERFGTDPPHDRYVLLESAEGERRGWHLSNSPLDGRTQEKNPRPNTPLRWRDLVATLVSPAELMRPMRRWLEGGA